MEPSMSFISEWLKEFDQEMGSTRHCIERVPTDKGQWRPHPKSFPIGHLAQLIAGMPGWSAQVARGQDIDLTKAGGYSFEPTEKLLAVFDKNVADAKAAVGAMSEADLDKDWSLVMGEKKLMTMPRREVLRQNMGHLSHHRGQMSVYLRLLDIPVPSIYGPSADDRGGF
jgi:uncharacterized damage-inducible protein DinB